VQERAQSERGAVIPELLLFSGGAAALHRCRRPAIGASADQRQARTQALRRDQEDEGRSGGGRKDERRNQGTLQQAVWGVIGRGGPGGIMRERRFSRRDVLKSSAAAVSGLFASPARAAALEPTAITPSLVAAARKEGRLFYYTSIDLPL